MQDSEMESSVPTGVSQEELVKTQKESSLEHGLMNVSTGDSSGETKYGGAEMDASLYQSKNKMDEAIDKSPSLGRKIQSTPLPTVSHAANSPVYPRETPFDLSFDLSDEDEPKAKKRAMEAVSAVVAMPAVARLPVLPPMIDNDEDSSIDDIHDFLFLNEVERRTIFTVRRLPKRE